MKKELSVWMLIVRSSLYKVLLILGILVGLQAGAFVLLALIMPDRQYYGWIMKVSVPVFLCAALAMTEVLSRVLTNRKGKMNYTLQRLRISEKAIFLLQASVNWMMFVLLLLVQATVLLGITAVYSHLHTDIDTGLSVLVTAQWNPLLRILLPYGDWLGVLWIVTMTLVLGVETAGTAFQLRKNPNNVASPFYLLWVITTLFRQRLEGPFLWGLIIPLVMIVAIIVMIAVTILLGERRKTDG